MSGSVEKFLQENSSVIMKVLQVLEGKSATARVKLDGIQFELGDAAIELSGEVDLKFVPEKKPVKKASKDTGQ
jgi:hypothetical protein